MQRRGFLQTSFFGGLAAGGAACATSEGARPEGRAPLADAELERTMRQLDRALAGIHHTPTSWFVGEATRARMTAAQGREAQLHGELLRSSLRSMLVTSTVSELPPASREDPRVTARLDEIVHEADFAALGTLAKLQALTPTELAAFDEEMRRNPDFVAEVVDLIDAQAVASGVSPSRRRHLRKMARHLSMELRRDSSATVIERTLRQAQRVMAKHVTLPHARALPTGPSAAKWAALTNEAITLFDQDPPPVYAPPNEPVAADPLAPTPTETAPPPSIYAPPMAPRPVTVTEACQCHPNDYACVQMTGCHKPFVMYKDRVVVREDAERKRMQGGVLLGVGLALMIPGAILAPFTLGLTGFAVTAGVIMLVIGIVFLVRGKRQLEALGAS